MKDLLYLKDDQIKEFIQLLYYAYRETFSDPKEVLSDWCNKINIEFCQSMLRWGKGSHAYDGIWWKFWYDNVITTTGFQKYEKKDITIEKKYDSIYNESMKYYNYLKEVK